MFVVMEIFLTNDEITEKLNGLTGWEFENDMIRKSFHFKNFRDATAFILRISFEAEELNHHPELYNCYNRVEINLNTHVPEEKLLKKTLLLLEQLIWFLKLNVFLFWGLNILKK